MINYTWYEFDESKINESLGFPPSKLDYPINSMTAFCPALKKNKDWWVIKSPYTYHLRHTFLEDGESSIETLPQSSFNDTVFDNVVRIETKKSRNSPMIPFLQFNMNIIFWTKEKDVTMELFPAFMNHELNKQPIVSIYGSYPISDWLRPLNFAFDWVNPKEDILIKRGSPLLYVKFSKKLPLKKVSFTPDIKSKAATCQSMSGYYHGQDWKWMFKHMRSLLFK